MDMVTVICPHCEATVAINNDIDGIWCEDCGTHPGHDCPACDEPVDLIFAEEV